MYSMVVFRGGAGVQVANVGSRDVNWRAWLMDDSNSCSRPTVLGHARCLRYWQPAEVHKGATVHGIVPADSLSRPPRRVM